MATGPQDVPVLEVTKLNLFEVWDGLVQSLEQATFVALDMELSGLGDKKLINAKSIPERYKAISDVARSRAVLSLGLSCFKSTVEPTVEPTKNHTRDSYVVKTFNILLLCSESYTVEPNSLTFLVEHGFDFNKQYALGIPYHRGDDKTRCTDVYDGRQLLAQLIRCRKPLVLHNALVDLIFLHHNFYSTLPPTVEMFLAQIHEIFPAGIYDTKFIADYKARMSASYLEYVFKKCLKENAKKATVAVRFEEPTSQKYVKWLSCDVRENQSVDGAESKLEGCKGFAAHGWCPNGVHCPRSHDVNYILENEDKIFLTKRKKRPRQRIRDPEKKLQLKKEKLLMKVARLEAVAQQVEEMEQDEQNSSDDGVQDTSVHESHGNSTQPRSSNSCQEGTALDRETAECSDKDMTGGHQTMSTMNSSESSATQVLNKDHNLKSQQRSCGHRAGFDSFMTGYAFAYFQALYNSKQSVTQDMVDVKNRVALSGKSVPLVVQTSAFTKVSQAHAMKISQLSENWHCPS